MLLNDNKSVKQLIQKNNQKYKHIYLLNSINGWLSSAVVKTPLFEIARSLHACVGFLHVLWFPSTV